MSLSVERINVGYGQGVVLHSLSLSVADGEVVALIGANGAGKTTLLLTISGLLRPTAGNIRYRNRDIGASAPHDIVSLGICHVPEGRHIFNEMSVRENLNIGAYMRRDRAAVRRDIDYVCDLFPILAQRYYQPGGTLSGGEQQMLAIARALIQRPSLLLLDEPSLGLAPLVVKQVFATIARINEERGVSILLVEQSARAALKIAARGYVLANGEVQTEAAAETLLHSEEIRRAYLGG